MVYSAYYCFDYTSVPKNRDMKYIDEIKTQTPDLGINRPKLVTSIFYCKKFLQVLNVYTDKNAYNSPVP